MKKVYGDFETRSESDLPTRGSMCYAQHPSTDIIFYTYLVEDNPTKVYVWFPGDPLPEHFTAPEKFQHYYFNAIFDWRILKYVGPQYGIQLPNLRHNVVDVMALCARFGYPQSLDRATQVLGTATKKRKSGKALIKKLCEPPYEYSHEDFVEFLEYGIDDTKSMYELVQKLPADRLSDREQNIWYLTQWVNSVGLPVDMTNLAHINREIKKYQANGIKTLTTLTKGEITSAGQTQRIRTYLAREFDVCLPNLQAQTVEAFLNADIPPEAKKILQLRRDLGPAAAKKFATLLNLSFKGRCHDNHRYYGGHTGRWSGMGFQLQNLPRAKSKDPEALLARFANGTVQGSDQGVLVEARKLVRPMIHSKALAVADYSSIENRLLAWFTDDAASLKLFRDGGDQYKDMASHRYNVPYEEVTKEQRFVGKVIILGCGYGMGAKKFKVTAKGFGLELTDKEADLAVSAYRKKYPQVPKMWYTTFKAAKLATMHINKTFKAYKCTFKSRLDRNKNKWLLITLPNKNTLYYAEPRVTQSGELVYAGINGYTKKWDLNKKILPGLLVENIIQATAREVLADGLNNLKEANIPTVGLIHDEVITLTKDLDKVIECICRPQDWFKGLPLEADGYVSTRYKKD